MVMTGYDVRVAWAAGGSDGVTERLTGVGPKLLDEVWTGPGMEVLDVATGSGGSIAIPAATRGATVTGVDLDPQHFEAGRRRAVAAGVSIEWIEAARRSTSFRRGLEHRDRRVAADRSRISGHDRGEAQIG
jgi:2-polyprenyl-3-methyl-5-hydroxy-6-metoxy-1,4-benzoquinol methylase